MQQVLGSPTAAPQPDRAKILTRTQAAELLPAGEVSTTREGRGYSFSEVLPRADALRVLVGAFSIRHAGQELEVQQHVGDPVMFCLRGAA